MEIGKPEREVTVEPARMPPGVGNPRPDLPDPDRQPQRVPQPEPVRVGPDDDD
jgi:hypothetical protein